jgi:hypothetical protein
MKRLNKSFLSLVIVVGLVSMAQADQYPRSQRMTVDSRKVAQEEAFNKLYNATCSCNALSLIQALPNEKDMTKEEINALVSRRDDEGRNILIAAAYDSAAKNPAMLKEYMAFSGLLAAFEAGTRQDQVKIELNGTPEERAMQLEKKYEILRDAISSCNTSRLEWMDIQQDVVSLGNGMTDEELKAFLFRKNSNGQNILAKAAFDAAAKRQGGCAGCLDIANQILTAQRGAGL